MVSKYKKGKIWYLNFNIGGRRYRVSTKTDSDELAEFKRQELELELFKCNNPYERKSKQNKISIAALFRIFLIRTEKYKAYTTWKTERAYLKLWQGFFNRKNIKYLDSISHKHISEFLEESDIMPRSFNNALTLLRTVFNYAISK